MGGNRWVIWTAVSSDPQADRYSLTEQSQLGRQHCTRWGGEVVAELAVAESRSIVLLEDAAARIPAYAQLREMIAARSFDVLCCYDSGRLGRKRSLVLALIELCADADPPILVYEIESPPQTLDALAGYDRQLLDAIKATGYQHEVEKFRARATYGRIGRIKAGRFPGRTPPYGYAYQYDSAGQRSTVTVPEAAAVVRRIVAEYLNGRGCNTIAATLTGEAIPSPVGGAWNKNSVHVVLKRADTYAGWSVSKVRGHGVIRARGHWEPIIDDATAARVHAERAARVGNRRAANSRGRLTGVVWCTTCRKPMRQAINETGIMIAYDKRPGRNPVERRPVFYCANYHPGASVGTRLVLAALRAAIDVLAGRDLTALADTASTRTDDLLAQVARCEAAIERHATALQRADSAYTAGLMDVERYAVQVQRIRAEVAAERARLDTLRAEVADEQARGSHADRLAEVIANGYALLDTPDTAAANAWLRQRVRVWVEDNMIVEVEWL